MSTTVLPCDRIRQGKPVTTRLTATFRDDGDGLPLLVLCQGNDLDSYRVEEIPTGMDGRAFHLHRSEQAKAADGPDADEAYGVFVARNGQDHVCECRGFQRWGRCKHHDAVRGLIEAGHLDRVEAGRPGDVSDLAAPGYLLDSDLELDEAPF